MGEINGIERTYTSRNQISNFLTSALIDKKIFPNIPNENTIKIFYDDTTKNIKEGFEALTIFVKESAEKFSKIQEKGGEKGSAEMNKLFADVKEENIFEINDDIDAAQFLQKNAFPELGIKDKRVLMEDRGMYKSYLEA